MIFWVDWIKAMSRNWVTSHYKRLSRAIMQPVKNLKSSSSVVKGESRYFHLRRWQQSVQRLQHVVEPSAHHVGSVKKLMVPNHKLGPCCRNLMSVCLFACNCFFRLHLALGWWLDYRAESLYRPNLLPHVLASHIVGLFIGMETLLVHSQTQADFGSLSVDILL